MFVALWEYEVKPGSEEIFENVYGPGVGWAKLFRSDPNYRETRLLRDPYRPATYLTLDFWNSREAYEQFMAIHKNESEEHTSQPQPPLNLLRHLLPKTKNTPPPH